MGFTQRRQAGTEQQTTSGEQAAGARGGLGDRLRTAGSYAEGQALLAPVQRKGGGDDAATTASEATRLREEMNKLAARNAWTGVESYFQKLLDLDVEMTGQDFFLAAQAARSLGKTASYLHRTKLAAKHGASAEEIQELEANVGDIERKYGDVVITHGQKKLKRKQAAPPLEREVMPFIPDERRSIEHAQQEVAGRGEFYGMLPVGTYTLGGQTYEVLAKEIGLAAVRMEYTPVERTD